MSRKGERLLDYLGLSDKPRQTRPVTPRRIARGIVALPVLAVMWAGMRVALDDDGFFEALPFGVVFSAGIVASSLLAEHVTWRRSNRAGRI